MTKNTTEKEDKAPVALITGGALRLGQALALALAEDGFDLIIHYNTSKREALRLAENLNEKGRRACAIGADLKSEKQVLNLAERAEACFGGVDLLINSAAIFHPTRIQDLTASELDSFIDVNLKAPYLLGAQIGPKMKARGKGQIINIDCLSADKPWSGFLPYSISKAALRACTLGLSQLFAPEVRVNGIAPGTVLPPEETTAAERKVLADRTLLKRIGSADDIVKAVRYLVAATFVTAEILTVDGGRSLRGGVTRT